MFFLIPLREVCNFDRYLSIEMRARKFIILFFFAFGGIKFQKKHVFLGPYSIFYTRSMFFLPLFGYEISWIPATQVAAGFNLHFFGKSYPARQQNRVKASCWLLGLAGPRFLRSNRGAEENRQ